MSVSFGCSAGGQRKARPDRFRLWSNCPEIHYFDRARRQPKPSKLQYFDRVYDFPVLIRRVRKHMSRSDTLPVSQGWLVENVNSVVVACMLRTVHHVRLRFLSEVNSGLWASVTEFGVVGK